MARGGACSVVRFEALQENLMHINSDWMSPLHCCFQSCTHLGLHLTAECQQGWGARGWAERGGAGRDTQRMQMSFLIGSFCPPFITAPVMLVTH